MGHKINCMISIDKDIYLTREFHELKHTRQLSKTVNDLLRQHLDIQETELDLEIKRILEEKALLEARLSAVEAKKQEEIRQKAEQASKWKVVF